MIPCTDQVKHMRLLIFECKGRSHDAFVLGVAAAVLLSAAHILVNLLGLLGVTGRDESQKPPPPSKKFSKPFFVLIWYEKHLFSIPSFVCTRRAL